MEDLIAPGLWGPIIQATSAIVVAVLAYKARPVLVARLQRGGKPSSNRLWAGRIIYAVVVGFAAGIVFLGAGWALTPTPLPLPPPATVKITSPTLDAEIEVSLLRETGAISFLVKGTSTSVHSDPDLRIYVLVHPINPPSQEWGVYAADPDHEGVWTATAWYGGGTLPVNSGNTLELEAVAARFQHIGDRKKVGSPKELLPVAESDRIRMNIGSINEPEQ